MVFKIIVAGSIPASSATCFIMQTNFTFLNFYFSFLKLLITQIFSFSIKSPVFMSRALLTKYNKLKKKNQLKKLQGFYYYYRYQSSHLFLFSNSANSLILDFFFTFIFNFFPPLNNSRILFRLTQTSNFFYSSYVMTETSLINIKQKSTLSYLWVGFSSLWHGLRFWILSIFAFIIIVYYLMYIKFVPFLKTVFIWFAIIMFVYWLMSGFVFFIKKYQTSKFTSVIQRFWRRSYILFWLIETSVFVAFLYLTFNASQEPFYMHDQINVFKTHLFSWRLFLTKIFLIAALLILSYILLLNLKWNIFSKQSIWFFFITLFLTFVVWLEFYQFFHIISYYGSLTWAFDCDERLWSLELDPVRTRISNNYVSLCLMAKFWHLIFIYIFWLFFILRSNELKRYRYPLLSANNQNFIILYIMSWLYMYPWLKIFARKYMDYSYFWFFTNSRRLGIRVFFTDLKLFFFTSYLNFFEIFKKKMFLESPFIYWLSSNYYTNFDAYRKHFIRDQLLTTLNY